MDMVFYSPTKLWPQLITIPKKPIARSDALLAESEMTSHISLIFGDILSGQENKSALSVISITREQIIALLGINALTATYELTPNQDIILEQSVVKEYAAVPEVTRIFIEKSKAASIFKVLIKTDSYNDELMDALLEKEYNIIEHFPTMDIGFHYFPYNINTRFKGYVGETAKLIFRD